MHKSVVISAQITAGDSLDFNSIHYLGLIPTMDLWGLLILNQSKPRYVKNVLPVFEQGLWQDMGQRLCSTWSKINVPNIPAYIWSAYR